MLPTGPWETTTDRDIKLRHAHSSLYYWFATTRVISEVGYHKARRGAADDAPGGPRPSRAAAARLGLKALLGRAGMRFDPTLRRLEDRARRWVSPP